MRFGESKRGLAVERQDSLRFVAYLRIRLPKPLQHQGSGSRHGLRVVTETGKPMDVRFPTKPGDLALGILARALLDRGLSRFECDFAAKIGAEFTITDEVEGLGALGETRGDYTAHLVEPARRQHRFCAPVDSFIERFARG